MTARVLGKLHETLGQGNYYEAHQMFHSVSQRLLKQKKIGEAIHLLTAGTQAMLQHGQGGSALDLFERLVEALGAPGTVESPSESRGAFASSFLPSLAHSCRPLSWPRECGSSRLVSQWHCTDRYDPNSCQVVDANSSPWGSADSSCGWFPL